MRPPPAALCSKRCFPTPPCSNPPNPQGDADAHTFYVLERGAAEVRIHKEEWGEERTVHAYEPGRCEMHQCISLRFRGGAGCAEVGHRAGKAGKQRRQ